MKKIYITLVSLASIPVSVNAQVYSTATFSGNNIEAAVNNGGVFFNDEINQSPAYEYPKGSGNHLVYANSFWFGAEDNFGNKKLAAQLYSMGDDLFPGGLKPLSANTSSGDFNNNEIYQVSKSEIDNHILNYSNSGYVVPTSIENWPAHGDYSAGYDFYSAPFVDVNYDGIYDPLDGDYPKIRGDYATYMILNDKMNVHASGGEPMGIECHFMFYQYETSDYLNNTVFLNLKVINRSTAPYAQFKVGTFLDPEIGNGADDAVGCDTNRRVMYAYNFNNNDDVYGANPPAIGVVNLNQSMDVFGRFNDDISAMTLPTTVADYQNFLDGKWKDGTPFTEGGNGYGGSQTTKYLFSGNPNNPIEWSEVEVGTASNESRMFMVADVGPLLFEEEICLDYAFVVGDGGNHIENVNNLLAVANDAQNFFNAQEDFVCEYYEDALKVETYGLISPSVYPNPSNGELTIDFKGEYRVEIHALDGRMVYQQSNLQNAQKLNASIDAGSYILSVIQNEQRYTTQIIVQ